MISQGTRLAVMIVALAGFGPAGLAAMPVEEFRATVQPILSQYCYDCHADGANKGNVALDQFKADQDILNNRPLWWKVLKNVRSGVMPPQKKARPTEEQKLQLARWIKYGAFGIDPSSPDPGRVTVRRLNRVEYRNTIRDLMGIDYNTDDEFPPDDSGYGFDNIGDVLSLSPLLLEKYLRAAETIVNAAVPAVAKVAPETLIPGRRFRGDGANAEKLSLKKEAAVSSTFTARHDGDYQLQVELVVGGSFNFDPARCEVHFKLDDQELLSQTYAWQERKDYRYNFKAPMTAGSHRLSFVLHPLNPPPATEPAQTQPSGSFAPAQTFVDLRVVLVKMTGPMDQRYWAVSPQYTRFFPRPRPPEDPASRRQYARQILADFARRAFRRPVEDRMLDRLVKLAEATYGPSGATFEQGVKQAIVAVLASPRFLFRVEQSQPGSSDRPWTPVDEYSLASRLSYFFWSTMPDQELIDLAAKGQLRANLQAQVKRLLSDPRAAALGQNFVGQWLQARDVGGISIDARVVLAQDSGQDKELQRQLAQLRARFAQRPANASAGAPSSRPAGPTSAPAQGQRQRNFNRVRLFSPAVQLDSELRNAMRQETELYFDYVLHDDRSVLEFIDSDYTFVNQKLAQIYGILNVRGVAMRRVTLPKDSPRGGLLTMGSTLVVTSNPTRTSPVKRGQFILDNILGMPVPPPLANVPALEASDKDSGGDQRLSFRQVLEIHRSQALCRSCHGRMDPLGLSLENFNALGMWRDKERGNAIDASGQLLTGEAFHDVRDLKKVLAANHRLDFYRCLAEKMLTYALGRGLEYYDVEAVDRIVDGLDRQDGRMSALVMGIVESAPFQERRNFNPAPVPMKVPQERAQSTSFGHEQRATE